MSAFGVRASLHAVLLFTFTLIRGYLAKAVSNVGRKQQWRQHTKASVFAERFMWKLRANRKQWDIAIANHAGRGQLPRSMLSLFGSPTPCGLLQVRNTLPRFKRPNSVNGNTARNAVAIS
jgi:hypothetical protein